MIAVPETPVRMRTLIIIALVVTMLGVGCSRPLDSEAAEEALSALELPKPPEPREGMIQIAAGQFLAGANEELFQFYLAQSNMNFPGMVEALRKQFRIPPRPIDLPRFYIQEFEVTNREFKVFVDTTGYRPVGDKNYLAHWEQATYPEWATDFPVVWVSVSDAESYCRWRQGYLPTEDQWEKASRGATGSAFPWGNEAPGPETSNFGRDQAEPIGNRPGDVSPFLVYDLGGNVREWTSSLTVVNGSEYRVIRGGSFALPARDTLTPLRHYQLARASEARTADVGFRCSSN